MANWVVVPRLGRVYSLGRAISEVQVISGQLDPELVPKKSVAEHIALSTFEIGALIGNLCAPWYGVSLPITIPAHAKETSNPKGVVNVYSINPVPAFTLPQDGVDVSESTEELARPWVAGIANEADQPGIIKITALRNDIIDAGTIKHARDISQFWGIAKGRNTQWQGSVAWIQHGNLLYVWVGGEVVITTGTNDEFFVMAYRNPGALDPTNDNDYMDIPDQHAPLVIAKAALLCMKQARMGDYQEVEGQVNQGIAQLSTEYEKSMALSIQRSKLEGVEQ